LIISISSGFLVTKISSTYDIGQDLSKQFFKAGKPWMMTSIIVTSLAFVPGLPVLPFLLLGTGAFLAGRAVDKTEKTAGGKHQELSEQAKVEKVPVESLLDVDRISVSVGVQLIVLFDPRKNSSVFDRIGALRRRFAQEMGIVIPLVRVRDNITLEVTAYEIRLSDVPVATGNLEPGMFLAMDPGSVQNKVDGKNTTEPVYGLPALWITPDKKETAELNGYTVIDPESVFITHLSETLKKHADELLTREDVQLLLDRLRNFQPALVGEVVGELVPIGILHRVLKNLLKDQVPIRELTAILESLAEHTSKTKNTTVLTELVRKSLCRTITQRYKDENGKISAIILEPALENQMLSTIEQQADEINLSLPTEITMDVSRKIAQTWKTTMDQGKDKIILLCDSRLRAPLAAMLARTISLLPVIAYDEIVLGTEVEPVETISSQISQLTTTEEKELIGSAK
jgi:flagellar biosynthesis protein FlhA